MAGEDPFLDVLVSRREAFVVVGALGVGGGAAPIAGCGSKGNATAARTATGPVTVPGCVLSPEVTDGPYYIANNLTRRNITEGRPGLPLGLKVTVVDVNGCRSIPGADVELWHADAGGVYSGFGGGGPGGPSPQNAKRFLRGHQVADASGSVLFDTIYPGWYPGRAPHIHLKVHVGGPVVHTGQIFFPDATSRTVYTTIAPYSSRGKEDVTNPNDMIYMQAGAGKATAHLTPRSGGHGFDGTMSVAVDRA